MEVVACVIVIVAEPLPTMWNMLLLAPTIVATLDGLTEKVYAPSLSDEGRSEKSLLPYVAVMGANTRLGVALLIVTLAFIIVCT